MRANPWQMFGLISVGALAACGGGGGGGSSGGFSTNLPGETEVQNLTSAQADQLCRDVNSYLMKQVDSPSFCQVAAVMATANQAAQDTTLTDGQLQQVCSVVATSVCTLLTSDAGASGSVDAGVSSCGSTAGCTATVAQLSACLTDTGTSFSTFEKMFPTCSMVTRARLATVDGGALPTVPPSCAAANTACPNFNPMPSFGALPTP